MVESLPSKRKARSSNPIATKDIVWGAGMQFSGRALA
jgi:hypothetical protein